MKIFMKAALLSSVTIACSLYGMGTAYAQSSGRFQASCRLDG